MAQYTPSSGDTVRPHRSPWGAFPTREFPVASTNAQIEAGTLVTLSTAAAVGGVAQFAVIPSTGAGALATFSAVGFTAGKVTAAVSSAVGPQTVSVWEANPMVEFKATTIGAAQVSSVIGLRKALQYDSTLKIHRIDLTASTATDWRVLITQNLGNEGDSGGYMAFRFINRLGDQINSTLLSSSPLLAFYS
jgi:hypothetical protein